MYLTRIGDPIGFGKDNKGQIITESDTITLLTLANAAAVKQDNPLSITEDFRLIKTELVAHLIDLKATDDVPINLYLADDEMSVAEIAEAIVTGGPLDRNDRLKTEQATRPVFLLGTFGCDGVNAVDHDLPVMGHKGQKGIIEKTIRWTFSSGTGWTLAAFNMSGGSLTTGTKIRFTAKHFGVWVT